MADSSTIEETENQTNKPGILSGGEPQLKEIFLNQSFTAGRFRISVKNITRVVYPKAKVLIEGNDLGIYDQIYVVFGNGELRVKSFFPNPAISTFIEFELPDLNNLLVDGATVQVKLVSLRNKEASGIIKQNLIYYTKSSEEGQGEKDSTSNNQKSTGRSAVGGSRGVFEGGVGAVVDATGAVMGGVVKPFVTSGKTSGPLTRGTVQANVSSGFVNRKVQTNVEDDFDSNDDVAQGASVRGSVSQNVANEVNATIEEKQTVTQKTQANIASSGQRVGEVNIGGTQTTTVSGGGGASSSVSGTIGTSGSVTTSGGGGRVEVSSKGGQTVSTQTNVEGNLGKTVNISANVNQSSPVSGKVEVNDKTNIDVKVKSQNVGKSKVESQIGASSSGAGRGSLAGGGNGSIEVNDSSNVDIQGGSQGLSSPGKKVSAPAGQSLGSSSFNQQSQPSGSVATLEQESPTQTIGVNVQRSAGPLGGLNVSEAISSKQNGVNKVSDNRPDKLNQPISQLANTKGVEPNLSESKNDNEDKEKQNEPGEKPLTPLKPEELKNPDQQETNPKEKENPEFKNKLNKLKDNDAALQRALPLEQGDQPGLTNKEPGSEKRSPNVQPRSSGQQGGGFGGGPRNKQDPLKQSDLGQEGKDLGKKEGLPKRESDNKKPDGALPNQQSSNLKKPDQKPQSVSPGLPKEGSLPGRLDKVSQAKRIIDKYGQAGKGIGKATSKVWYYGLGISAGVFFSGLDFFVGALIMDAYWIFGHRKDKNLFPLSLWQKVVTIFANLAPFLYAAVIVVLIAIAGCNYPVGKISGSYKLSYMGIAGYGEVCEALESAGSGLGVTGETGGAIPTIPGGVCSVAASGPASVENLASTCFGANAGKASAIAVAESGGNPVSMSRVDKCGNDSVSVGLFQINLTAHRVAGLNCPSAFNRRYDGPSSACQVINRPLYDACVAAAKLPENNIQEACRISGNGQSWSAWGANRRCGF
jgi:hypothetical protein